MTSGDYCSSSEHILHNPQVPFTPFEKQADITLRTNFFGTLSITQALLPMMRASNSPRIVNVASAAGRLRGSAEKQRALTSPELTVNIAQARLGLPAAPFPSISRDTLKPRSTPANNRWPSWRTSCAHSSGMPKRGFMSRVVGRTHATASARWG